MLQEKDIFAVRGQVHRDALATFKARKEGKREGFELGLWIGIPTGAIILILIILLVISLPKIG